MLDAEVLGVMDVVRSVISTPGEDVGVKVNIVLEVDGVDIDTIRIGGGLDSFIYFPVPFKEKIGRASCRERV